MAMSLSMLYNIGKININNMTMPFIELKSVLITFGQIKYIRINEFVNILIRFDSS